MKIIKENHHSGNFQFGVLGANGIKVQCSNLLKNILIKFNLKAELKYIVDLTICCKEHQKWKWYAKSVITPDNGQ